MVHKCLKFLAEDGKYSKKRIGVFITGIVLFGFLIWLIVLTTLVGKCENCHTTEGNYKIKKV